MALEIVNSGLDLVCISLERASSEALVARSEVRLSSANRREASMRFSPRRLGSTESQKIVAEVQRPAGSLQRISQRSDVRDG